MIKSSQLHVMTPWSTSGDFSQTRLPAACAHSQYLTPEGSTENAFSPGFSKLLMLRVGQNSLWGEEFVSVYGDLPFIATTHRFTAFITNHPCIRETRRQIAKHSETTNNVNQERRLWEFEAFGWGGCEQIFHSQECCCLGLTAHVFLDTLRTGATEILFVFLELWILPPDVNFAFLL